jgi:carbon-monoxide dehydrogenase medium subunit
VRFPVWDGRCGFAVEEFARRAGDFAVTGAACGIALSASSDKVDRAAIALFGMGPTPLRASEAEGALAGAPVTDVVPADIGQLAVAGTDPPDDLHGTSAYRRSVGAHLVGRAVTRAMEAARRA